VLPIDGGTLERRTFAAQRGFRVASTVQSFQAWALLALLLPLGSAAALVVHILTGLSLYAGIAILGGFGGAGFAFWWRQLVPPARRELGLRIKAAAGVGFVATLAYDFSRFALDSVWAAPINPFEAWPVFGELLTAAPRGSWLALAVGATYHLVNGVGLGVAYALVVKRPGPISGVLWGLGLELVMALLYPSWLRIRALEEFLTISIFGHVIYGFTLGMLGRRRVGEWA
jgi:hypothetical protein